MSKILVHACCGPCLYAPHKKLKEAKHELTIFYFNPNIQPEAEYRRRLDALGKYLWGSSQLIIAGYNPREYYNFVNVRLEKEERCRKCYRLRLEKTAVYAVQHGFKNITSTLLSSPYQYHEAVKELGEEIAKDFKLKFVYEDFRPGYYDGVNKFREEKWYRQKYCGCFLSENEAGDRKGK